MVKLESSRKKSSDTRTRAPLPQWHSSHIHLQNKLLETSRQQALGRQISVYIQLIKTIEYTADGLESLEPNVFYVPHGTNQSAVDPFILVDGFLYIFQMTIQPIHAINHGLVDSANSYDFPPRSKWRFVFITPPNLVLVVPQPR